MLTRAENPLPSHLAQVLSAAMKLERQHHRHARPYEQTDAQYRYPIGRKKSTLKNRLRTIENYVRQVRGSNEAFRPASLDTTMASEQALCTPLDQVTFQGVTPRWVKDVLESLFGSKFQ